MVTECASTSPSIRPSICSSPSVRTLPTMCRSEAMIDGPRLRWLDFGRDRAGTRAVPVESPLFFKNIAQMPPRLEELAWIIGLAVDPYLVVQMLAGAAAGAAHDAHLPVQRHLLPGLHQHLPQMAVTGRDPHAVVDLDHVAVGAGRPGAQ